MGSSHFNPSMTRFSTALLVLVVPVSAAILGPKPVLVHHPVFGGVTGRHVNWAAQPHSQSRPLLRARTSMGMKEDLFSARRPRDDLTKQRVFGGTGGSMGGGFPGGRGPRDGPEPGTLTAIAFGLLLLFAPGVVFGAFNFVFMVVTLGPLLLTVGVQLYTKLNIIEAPCPVCGVELQGVKSGQSQCPNCGSLLEANKGKFEALGTGYVRDERGFQQEFSRRKEDSSGVIDVDAIDVED